MLIFGSVLFAVMYYSRYEALYITLLENVLIRFCRGLHDLVLPLFESRRYWWDISIALMRGQKKIFSNTSSGDIESHSQTARFNT
jgi:hypothetical protein